ncbi:MAG: hypothetical protein ACRDVW_00055, partial [Acidimicrobiales bacterium]
MNKARALGALSVTTALGTAYVLERALAGRWRASEEELSAAGLWMPSDAEHHFVTTDDGGRIHIVEAGHGPPVV